MTDELETLVAKDAIRDVIYSYCRAMDRMDRELALSVWHPGGSADYGSTFHGTCEGFVEWVWTRHAGLEAHSHQVTNILIEVDGDKAASEAYAFATLRQTTAGESVDIIVRGRYLDVWSKRDGRWAIDARTFVTDVRSVYVPRPEVARSEPDPRYRRDASDPSYELFKLTPALAAE